MEETPKSAGHDSNKDAGHGPRVGMRLNADVAVRAALALGILVLLGPFLLLSGREIALSDDAYYYLLPAANFWELGFYSFDGRTNTNGFHPLWMLMLTACALPLHLAGAIEEFPRAALWLSIALVLWGSLAWFDALRRGGAPRLITALVVLVVVVSGQDLLLLGLETPAIYWSLALLARYLVARVEAGAPIQPGWLAFYSLLVLFSRLDCGLFLLLLYAVLVFHAGARRVITAGVLLTLLAAPYLLLNVAFHGAATPISGRVKQHWGDRFELETAGRTFGVSWAQLKHGPGAYRLREIGKTYLPRDIAPGLKALTLDRVDTAGDQKGWAPYIMVAVAIAAGIRLGWVLYRGWPPAAMLLVSFAGALGVFYAASTAYYALSYDRVWPWYGAPGVMLFAGTITFLAGSLLRFRGGDFVQVLLLAVLLVFWTDSNARGLDRAEKNFPRSLRAVQLDLADWLARNTPEDAVAAGWAVGELGWYAQRPVINLEGLVGDESLLEANRATDLLPFMARHKVARVTNFWRPAVAPRPEELLAPAYSDGQWNGDPVRYFWTLRLRLMMDCPEAFTVLYRNDAGDAQETSGYVLGVDQEAVARYLEDRERWRAEIAASATVLPAEDFTRMRAGKVEANIRRSERYFVRGSDLAYSLEMLRGGDYEVYGRVCNLHNGGGEIKWRHRGEKPVATVAPDPVWRHVRLGSLRIEESGAGGELVIEGMSAEVYLDQLYLVRREHQATFEALPADWRGDATLR